MLFEMPTGSGKTYQARKIIGKYIKGEILQNVPTITTKRFCQTVK